MAPQTAIERPLSSAPQLETLSGTLRTDAEGGPFELNEN